MNLKERCIDELKIVQQSHDTEMAHSIADDILCEFLTELGYIDVVEEYNKIDKWYA